MDLLRLLFRDGDATELFLFLAGVVVVAAMILELAR